ncbi:hypothetical protein SAMN06295912_108158 [Sphingomonas laterariae]|uniref:UPF0246 protein SAMN06295912_108158 n=1 Tax=Edaphosphingomonas laterariae TaxID=861865 RepID=A0A239FCA6_9SPHN|nr:peroxide stress protein YaaA [Sphingomonas laterariae]SNS54118.1 hypothetical protein SAMN06295912_108158 [Sphingomonas laterariae]
MLALLSPAKSLDYQRPLPPYAATQPRFAEEAQALAAAAAGLGAKKLGELMHISDKLAALNAERFDNFASADARAALYAFNGDVYLGFEAHSLDEAAIAFAQDHVRILSGLYGLLRPLDLMRPYRLEMGTRWAPGRPKNLYQYWGDRVSRAIADDLAAADTDVLINTASQEYWGVVSQHPPEKTRIITVEFREHGPKGLRFNSFAAKRARGMMARWMCEHRIDRPEHLKGFDSDGYHYDAAGSDGDRWLFVRGAAVPAE